MELIYTDHNRYALGQLSSFDIDFDATGDKDFELIIDEHILRKGYWFYIPDTEIGGIVDGITVNTKGNSVKYSGRNFRGVLADKVIPVPSGQTYVSVQGDIDDVINSLIADAGLDSLFTCLEPTTVDYDYYVDYAFEPFCTLYDGLIKLGQSINFKLIFTYNVATNKVEITPTLSVNYTDFLTYTKNSSVNLQIEDNAMGTNHFLLVGYAEDGKRYQISLYINENAQVMDYATVQNPIKDSQYILDNRNQQYFGVDERCEVQINDKITPIENYEYLKNKPKDWSKRYASYYYQATKDNGDGTVDISYENFEPVTAYRQLTSQPADWAQNFASYFYKYGGEYESVNGESTTDEEYEIVRSKPAGWKNNFGDYYYKENDGTGDFFSSISGKSVDHFIMQTYMPSDWNENYGSYYQVVKKTKGELVGDLDPTDATAFEAAGTYSQKGKNKKKGALIDSLHGTPKWQKYKYYTKKTETVAPSFDDKIVYARIETTTDNQPPTFVANQFYQQYETAPNFTGAYRLVYDHYSGMVEKLLDDLNVYPVNNQEVSLVDFDADIGDVVGGYDEKTDITLVAPITNIIYKIERGIQRSIE